MTLGHESVPNLRGKGSLFNWASLSLACDVQYAECSALSGHKKSAHTPCLQESWENFAGSLIGQDSPGLTASIVRELDFLGGS